VWEDGDTLTIPVGTASWTSVLAVGKAITIQGAGIGQTIIQDDTSTNDVLLDVTLVADQTTRITGIEFEPGARATLALFGAINVVGANTDNRRIRIDHCKFDTLYRSAETINTVLGVFDHNTVIRRVTNGGGMGAIKGSTWDGATHGDGAMTAADDFGTDKFYFVEDCDFSSDTGAAYTLIDAQAGGRYVFRYNTVNNGSIESHGLEAAGERSGRAFEVYNNTFTGNNTRSTVGYYRGGVGLWHDNTISGFTTSCVVSLINNRSIEHLAFPFNGSDGRNVWDVNSGSNPFDTGTVTTGGAKTFTDTSKSWTPDDKWIGYTLRKTSAVPITSLTRSSTTITVTTTSPHGFSTGDEVSIFGANEWGFNYIYSNITVTGANTWTSTVPTSTGVPASGTGTMYCTKGVNFGEIVDSTANTVTVASGIFTANNMVLAAGETYEINKVTHSMDQPGRMGGTLLTGAYPALPGGWNNQTTSPWYEWNNLREGGADVDFSSLAAAGLTYAVVTAGTHYINDTVKPGYTPYTYPHPLVSGAADTTAPALAGCIVTVPGTTITLTFSEAVTRNSGTPTVSLSGGACSLSYSSGSGSSGHIYTLSRTVYAGETGTMSAAPGANGWEDAAGNDFAVVSNGPLTNNSTATPGGGSTAFGAGAGTASFGSGAGSVSFQ